MSPPSFRRTLIPLLMILALSACGGDGDDTPSVPSSAVSGTAAVGAALSGATVSVKCSGGNAPGNATTTTAGGYTLTIPDASFPCVLRVSGGNASAVANTLVLHSFAKGGGTVNVTPLTDLALARSIGTAAGQSMTTWFNTPSNWSQVSDGLTAALDALRQALDDAGYDLPASWTAGSTTPLNSTFTPNPATDPFDALLETIAEAIESSGAYEDYQALLQAFATGGGSLPDAPEPTEPDPELPAPTGNGSALDGSDGATGTLAGTTYTYRTNTTWSSLTRGFTVFGSPTDAVSRWALQDVPASVGTHYCKSNGELPRIQLVVNNVIYDTAPTGGACRIEVQSVTADTITGRFSATLMNAGGQVVGTVTDGYFRKTITTNPPTNPDPEPPATEDDGALDGRNGATGTLNGTTYTTINSSWFQGNFASGGLENWRLSRVPRTAGTYTCSSAADSPSVELILGNRYYGTAPAGGACTIEILSVSETHVEGRFTATLRNSFAPYELIGTISDGFFRKRP